jgi:hypothetical protein
MSKCICGVEAATISMLWKGEYVGSICEWCANEYYGTTTEYNSSGVVYGREDMGGKMSRNKGARGEREVYKILQPVVDECFLKCGKVPPLMERNGNQSRRGGYDIVGLDWMAIEVKYQEKLNLRQWWQQTIDQCAGDQKPVLFFRRNRIPWRVKTTLSLCNHFSKPCDLILPVVMDIDDFIRYFARRVMDELTKSP